MQTVPLAKWVKAQSAQIALQLPWPGIDESTAIPDPAIGDLDETRAALGEAARVIREQEERIRRLESMALTDELTGLLNRRGLLLSLQRELAAAKRDDAACGVLIMADLDGFKSINDQWGHAAGDEYLQAAADALKAGVRASDVAARLGGDEFAILLTRISAQDGAARVDAMDRAFNGQILGWSRPPVALRASFGFASYSGLNEVEEIMASADFKLYAHKAHRKASGLRMAQVQA